MHDPIATANASPSTDHGIRGRSLAMATGGSLRRCSSRPRRNASLSLGRLAAPAMLGFAAAAHVGPCGPAAVADDRSVSTGHWNVVAAEWDGTTVDREWLARLQVLYRADGSWMVTLGRLPVAEGTSTNDEERLPKTFEMATLGSEGIQPRRFRGIYRLDGDRRVLCFVAEGRPRPEEFSSPSRSDRVLVTLERSREPVAGKEGGTRE